MCSCYGLRTHGRRVHKHEGDRGGNVPSWPTRMSAAAWQATNISPADREPQGRDACLRLSSKKSDASGSQSMHAQRLCDRITRRCPRGAACALACDEGSGKHMSDTIVVFSSTRGQLCTKPSSLPSAAYRTQAAMIQRDGRFLHDSGEHGMSLAAFRIVRDGWTTSW